MEKRAGTGREIELSFGNARALVGTLGASLRRYYTVDEKGGERDLIWGYSGDASKKAGQGDVLIPFPGRIRDGRYRFAGKIHQLEKNDKEGPNAIHGFLREVVWDVEAERPAGVALKVRLRAEDYAARGYPFSVEASLSYSLSTAGLTCEFSVKNVGSGIAPVGVGFHPYLELDREPIDGAWVRIPATQYLEFEGMLPTGRVISVEGSPMDFRTLRQIGSTRLNNCFTGILRDKDGLATVTLSRPGLPQAVALWFDKGFPFLVVYSGDAIPAPDARRRLAVEPMTCGSDGFNHPEWGTVGLEPGGERHGRFGIRP